MRFFVLSRLYCQNHRRDKLNNVKNGKTFLKFRSLWAHLDIFPLFFAVQWKIYCIKNLKVDLLSPTKYEVLCRKTSNVFIVSWPQSCIFPYRLSYDGGGLSGSSLLKIWENFKITIIDDKKMYFKFRNYEKCHQIYL